MFLVMTIIMRHRSVWLAGGLGFCMLIGLYRERLLSLARMGLASVLIFVLMLTAFILAPELGSSLKEKFAAFSDPYSDGTASWRIEGWIQQLDQIKTKPLFGQGLGGYYSVRRGGKTFSLSPHNAYVQMLLKFGLMGLIVYGLVAYSFFRTTLLVREKLPRGAMRAYVEIGIVNFGAAHAYMIGYGFSLIMLIYFALAMSAVSLQRDYWLVSRPI